jgi:hypothetical protein
MSEQLRLAIRRPNDSGSGSEEEKMSTIALSHKAAKLMKLCDLEGYKRLHDLLRASTTDSVCPAICMTEGCDYTTEMERDQDAGYCEACGGNTVTSALVLAGLIWGASDAVLSQLLPLRRMRLRVDVRMAVALRR